MNNTPIYKSIGIHVQSWIRMLSTRNCSRLVSEYKEDSYTYFVEDSVDNVKDSVGRSSFWHSVGQSVVETVKEYNNE